MSAFAPQDSVASIAIFPRMSVAQTFVKMAPHVMYNHQISYVNVHLAMEGNFVK